MKKYLIKVNDKYFAGETDKTHKNTIGQSSLGFFQMTNASGLNVYMFSENINEASELAYCNIVGYIEGMLERQRYGILNIDEIKIIRR